MWNRRVCLKKWSTLSITKEGLFFFEVCESGFLNAASEETYSLALLLLYLCPSMYRTLPWMWSILPLLKTFIFFLWQCHNNFWWEGELKKLYCLFDHHGMQMTLSPDSGGSQLEPWPGPVCTSVGFLLLLQFLSTVQRHTVHSITLQIKWIDACICWKILNWSHYGCLAKV